MNWLKRCLAMLAIIVAVSSWSGVASAQIAGAPGPGVPTTTTTPTPAPSPAPAQLGPGGDKLGQGKYPQDYQYWQSQFAGDKMTCWGCNLFQHTADATTTVGTLGVAAFQGPARSAVAAFMGLWVLWQLYLMLSISHANSPAQSIDTIFNRLVIMTIVLTLLGSQNLYTDIMTPVLSTMGSVMDSSSTMLTLGNGVSGQCANGGGAGYIGQGTKLLCSMQKELGSGLALGVWMVMSAKMTLSFTAGVGFDFQQFVMGFVLMAIFGFMMVILPFRFFDALVRIAIVAAILPLVILAFLFKPTKGVVKQAVTSVLTSILIFLFTAIAMAVAVTVLQTVTNQIYQNVSSVGMNSGTSDFGGMTGSDFMVVATAALGMASMLASAGKIAEEFAGFQGHMGNAGAAGAAVAGGAANLAGKGAGMATGAGVMGVKVGGALTKGMEAQTGAMSAGFESMAGAIKAGSAG